MLSSIKFLQGHTSAFMCSSKALKFLTASFRHEDHLQQSSKHDLGTDDEKTSLMIITSSSPRESFNVITE